ncbi:hypothetical protein GP486_003713 [Trichoglossum hirsutum]|uniref:Uncharacterized protein n=1 Tax=Trichoglossum hirsutum TaxID=265104 RepID=A0A9P8RQS8_9PEZI|nr:hypothetical protein GP486_003713 [Trichoglossum hirsutum]
MLANLKPTALLGLFFLATANALPGGGFDHGQQEAHEVCTTQHITTTIPAVTTVYVTSVSSTVKASVQTIYNTSYTTLVNAVPTTCYETTTSDITSCYTPAPAPAPTHKGW